MAGIKKLINFWEQNKPEDGEKEKPSKQTESRKQKAAKLHEAPVLKESPPKRRKLNAEAGARQRSETLANLAKPAEPSPSPKPKKKKSKAAPALSDEEAKAKLLSYKRRLAALEILSSERSYVTQLAQFVEHFLEPLKKTTIIADQERNAIFSEVEIVLHLNKVFLAQIEERMANFSSSTLIADIFLSFMPHFKMYTQYCYNYPTALQTMTALCDAKGSKFKGFIKKAELISGKRFIDLLIMPVQRVPRYVMLLQSLVQHTTDAHPDFQQLQKALAEAQNAANIINEKLREAENRAAVISASKRFDSDTIEGEDLVQPHRQFIKEAVFAYKEDEDMEIANLDDIDDIKQSDEEKGKIYCMLFNDLFLTSVSTIGKDKEQLLALDYRFDLAQTWVKPDQEDGTCFTLINPKGTIVLRCPSAQIQQTWIELINNTIDNLVKINRAASESRQQVTLTKDKETGEWFAEVAPLATCKQIDSDQYQEQVLNHTQSQLNSLLTEQGAALSKLKLGTSKKPPSPRKNMLSRVKESVFTPQKKEKRRTVALLTSPIADLENIAPPQFTPEKRTPVKAQEPGAAQVHFLSDLHQRRSESDGVFIVTKQIDLLKRQLSDIQASRLSPPPTSDTERKKRKRSTKHQSMKFDAGVLQEKVLPNEILKAVNNSPNKFGTIKEEPISRKSPRKEMGHRRRQSIMVPQELSRTRNLEDIFAGH